ncbi:hypothetical protein K8I85_06200 [bacterium]|nr:hypothetical protein [bacterium]
MRKTQLLQGRNSRRARFVRAGLLTVAVAALLSGCNDDVVYVEDGPPAVPTGVYTITGDEQVTIQWYPVREDDVEGYGVYRSRTLTGAYDRIATVNGIENTTYVDDNVANGVTYYYAVDAFDRRGHESDLSYEDAFDTPRPAGFGVTVNAREVAPTASGLDLSGWRTASFVTAWNGTTTDFYVDRDEGDPNGTLYLVGTNIGGYWNDIQDLGYTESMDDVSWAPADGWSVSSRGVELIPGHTYVVWTHDSYFAKLRVVAVLQTAGIPSAILIDWAYQVDQSNPELAPPARVATGGDGSTAKEDA